MPDWRGRTVVCIASGPSLTPEDCELVRAAGHPTVVVNTSFRLAPWAEILFAWDWRWWREYAKEVRDFKGRRFTALPSAERFGAVCIADLPWFPRGFQNSGACAVGIAIAAKAEKVLMLGFDCQAKTIDLTDAEVLALYDWSMLAALRAKAKGDSVKMLHWHGAHPESMSNAASIDQWPTTFEKVAKRAKSQGVRVVNVSRETALTCFPRAALEEQL